MSVDVCVHGADERYVIHNAREVRQELGDIYPALAVLLKFPGAAEQLLARAIDEAERDFAGVVLSAAFRQFRLGIEQVDVAWPAVHEEGNHRARLRTEQGSLVG